MASGNEYSVRAGITRINSIIPHPHLTPSDSGSHICFMLTLTLSQTASSSTPEKLVCKVRHRALIKVLAQQPIWRQRQTQHWSKLGPLLQWSLTTKSQSPLEWSSVGQLVCFRGLAFSQCQALGTAWHMATSGPILHLCCRSTPWGWARSVGL